MSAISRVALIVNSNSRTGEEAFDAACSALKALHFDVDAHSVTDASRLSATVQEAIERRPDLLILGGGDGTISSLIDHLVGTGIPLGLIPLGTANSFARSLGIPIDIDEAVNIIAAGHRRRIDLGMIGDDYFANFAAMGMSPLIAETIPQGWKKWGGRVGYMMWAALQTLRFRPFRLTIRKPDGASVSLHALEVRIANGSFQGGTELVEDAEVDSGEIVVQVVEGRTHGRLALSWLLAILRLPRLDKTTREFRGREIHIDSEPSLPISIDGEVLARTPVAVRVAPGIIDVLAPPR